MLKYFIFITVITLFESCNDSRVQGSWFGPKSPEDFHCYVGKTAEDNFIAEEEAKSKHIEDLKAEKQENADKLSVTKTASTWLPRKSFKPWVQIGHYFGKFVQSFRDLKNILWRDWFINPELKKAKKNLKKEALFDYNKGQKICQEAFRHKFFTHVKKWELVANHKDTIANDKIWVRVQTPHLEIVAEYEAKEKIKEDVAEYKAKEKIKEEKRNNPEKNYELEEKKIPEVKRKKFWRPTKLCIAKKKELDDKDDPNEPFKVYISAAEGYGKRHPNTFVFLRTPRNLRDWMNYLVFWWHHVVHVEGYLW